MFENLFIFSEYHSCSFDVVLTSNRLSQEFRKINQYDKIDKNIGMSIIGDRLFVTMPLIKSEMYLFFFLN